MTARSVTVFIGTYMDCTNEATVRELRPSEFVVISTFGDLDKLRDVVVKDVVLVGPPFPGRVGLERNVRALIGCVVERVTDTAIYAHKPEPSHAAPPEHPVDHVSPETTPEGSSSGSPAGVVVDNGPGPRSVLPPSQNGTAPDADEHVRPTGNVGDSGGGEG